MSLRSPTEHENDPHPSPLPGGEGITQCTKALCVADPMIFALALLGRGKGEGAPSAAIYEGDHEGHEGSDIYVFRIRALRVLLRGKWAAS